MGEWINVGDRLPEETGFYLVYMPNWSTRMEACFYQDGKGWEPGSYLHEQDMITHWMPLPGSPDDGARGAGEVLSRDGGREEKRGMGRIATADVGHPAIRIEFCDMGEARSFATAVARGLSSDEQPFYECPSDYGLESNTFYCGDYETKENCEECWKRALIRNAVENAGRIGEGEE